MVIKIKILDVMILVGATALGFGVVRPFIQTISGNLDHAHSAQQTLWVGMTAVWPVGVAWTIGVLILRLRREPRISGLLRRPGDVACGTAVVVLTVCLLPFLAFAIKRGFRVMESHDEIMFYWSDSSAPTFAGLAVAATWLTLAVKRRWHSSKDWVDQAGRILGIIWIGRVFLLVICVGMEVAENLANSAPLP